MKPSSLLLAILAFVNVFATAASAQLARTPEMKTIWTPQADAGGYHYGFDILGYSPDGKTLAVAPSGSSDERVRLWEFRGAARRALEEPKTVEFMHRNQRQDIVFSPDGEWVMGTASMLPLQKGESYSNRKFTLAVLIWNADDGKLIETFFVRDEAIAARRLEVRKPDWTQAGPALLLVGGEHTPSAKTEAARVARFVFDAKTRKLRMQPIVRLDDSIGRDLALGISPDGTRVAGGSNRVTADGTKDNRLTIWDAATGRVLRELENPDASRFIAPGGHGYPRATLLFSRDNQLLLAHGSLYERGKARVWEIASDKSWLLEGEQIYPAAFSRDGKLIAGDGIEGHGVTLWDARSGQRLGAVKADLEPGYLNEEEIAFWPDASTLVSSDRRHVVTWSVEKLRALSGKTTIASAPVFGAPEVEIARNDDIEAIGNNYGFQVRRVSQKVSKPGEKEHSELVWQVQNARTGEAVGNLPTGTYYGDENRAVKAIAPGGKMLAVTDWDGEHANARILRWDVIANRALEPIIVPKEFVEKLRFSPDGKLLAGSSGNVRVRLWDARSGRLRHRFAVGSGGYKEETGYGQNQGALAFSPDGKTLALPGTTPGEPVVFYDVRSGAKTSSLRSSDLSGVTDIAFSPDGKALATGGDALRVWDLTTAKSPNGNEPRRAFVPYDWQGYATDAAPTRCAFVEADGQLKILVTGYGTSYRWHAGWLREPKTRPLRVLQNPNVAPNYQDGERTNWDNYGLLFSPDGQTLVAAGTRQNKNTVNLWDVKTGKLRHTLAARNPYAFSPDGRKIHASLREKTPSSKADPGDKAFDLQTGIGTRVPRPPKNARVFSLTDESGQSVSQPIQFQLGVPLRRAYSSATRPMRFWLRDPDWLETSAFSDDGARLAGAVGSRVWLWDVGTQKRREMESIGDALFLTLAFSPDGKTLAGATIFGTVHFWDVPSGDWKGTITGHTGAIFALAFSPGGELLATGGEDYTIRLWNATTGAHLKTIDAHANTITALAFSRDGKTLASSGYDNTVKLWDAR